MFERLAVMLKKEFIQTFLDPRMRAVLFVVPVLQALVFGYAVTTDVKDVRTALYDLDNTPESRELADRFTSSGYFRIVERIGDDGRAAELLDHGTVHAVLRMNRGFGEEVRAGRTAPVQLLLDGSDSNTAGIILSYTSGIVGALRERPLVRNRAGVPIPGGVRLESRAWYNENLESRNFYVPGVIALLLMVITLMLSAMAVVREKEMGTIEQIMVTPIGRAEFILGKTIPFMLIGLFDVVLISAIAVFWFQIPIRGNPLLLLLSAALYLVSMLSIGIFISTVSKTQQQAMMTGFFFVMPAMLLSGFIYPIANMPLVIQWLTYLDPLRYFLVIIRGVFLKGIGFDLLWPQMLGLALLGTLMLVLAALRFKKTMA